MTARSALEVKVRDFLRNHAPQDEDKASIVLSLGLPPSETMSMLAGKYGVSHALVISRSSLTDKLLEHGASLDDPYTSTLQYLETVSLAAVYDVPSIVRKWNGSLSRTTRGDSSARVVELSPTPARGSSDFRDRHSSTSAHPPGPNAAIPSPYPRAAVEYDASGALADAHEHGRSVSAAASGHLAVRPPLLEDASLKAYHAQLIALETALFQRCMELELATQQAQQQEASVKQDAGAVLDREQAVRRQEEQLVHRSKAHEVDMTEQTTRLRSEQQHLEEARRRVTEQQRTVDAAQRDVAEREAKIAAAMQVLASREAAAASQLKLSEQERALCQKLSGEVLKRETAVRSVERTLAAAKTELVRLEDELNSRAKQLVEDEGATRRWAAELEKKELTVQSIFEQLRHKGIHVSY